MGELPQGPDRSSRSYGYRGSDPLPQTFFMGRTRGPYGSLFRIGSMNRWIDPNHAHLYRLLD